ncbi:MAG: MOSC domain-containing protein [Verrucomicrobiota bacterium]
MNVQIRQLFISPGHNFFGRHGQAAGEHATVEVAGIVCRAGRGVEGDRFLDYKPDYPGQITFFSWEVVAAARRKFSRPELSAGAFRRNVVVEGLDLPALIGRRFSLGGVDFAGVVESKPCYWMEQAVGPGAEAWLRGNGGLRARILCDGPLAVGPAELGLAEAAP